MRELRFLGAHAFDLLDKAASEVHGEAQRRRFFCEALVAIAASGAPVVRLWGSRKQTGSVDELAESAALLSLLLDENALRQRPLRFVVALVNHQAGYGAPDPTRSLDDQASTSPWSSARFYLDGGWRQRGQGLLGDRIEAFARDPVIAASPYVIAFELINELDTHRLGAASLEGERADQLRERFLLPAASLLASSLPQPFAIGDLRGNVGPGYRRFVDRFVAALPREAAARLVWTSHVYVPMRSAGVAETRKLDADLAIATAHGLPFYLGELGQYAQGKAPSLCGKGPAHDLPALFDVAFGKGARQAVGAAIVWGEGFCAMPALGRTFIVGKGGDSADLSPDDDGARAFVAAQRASSRWSSD